ncbi:aldehyde dehydrogenase family protein [Propionivibrio soli]|jgi:sulfoacetaldehyde dehydrogenase|uniref:aldehyde dehydrogenase family protein n=1 Tax=Propionivibrio soli TaxID=2976531 RepID=UPI0021E7FF02|nr:aldehyde dehydrogenase family protein [Propionivibrio soli]
MSRQNDMPARYAELKLNQDQIDEVEQAFVRADKAQREFEKWDQEAIDRAIRSVAQMVANSKTFHELVEMGIQESDFGDPISREAKRFKIRGILRDCLREKSVGIIEEIPEKKIVKYAKPVGVIGCVIPATNPDLTPAGNAIYAIKARNAIIFSPHPRTLKTSRRTCELMREGLRRVGAPEDLVQILGYKAKINKGISEALMTKCDLIIATGGQGVVRRAYMSGTPAYAVGAGNATMIWDETAAKDLNKAAFNTMRSKTSDYGSGCSADGNIVIHESIWDAALKELVAVGGYMLNPSEQEAVKKVMWDEELHRLPDTVALSPQAMAKAAGFEIGEDRKFLIASHGTCIYNESPEGIWCREKLTTLLAVHKYKGEFQNAIDTIMAIHEVGGIGHSVGIFSFDDEHIHRLAMVARVGRIMVRQPQSKANAGSMNNGMPMTSSIGCGTWAGNATSENIHLHHYMNVTWVSREYDKPDWMTDEELFGEFFDPELEKIQYSPF